MTNLEKLRQASSRILQEHIEQDNSIFLDTDPYPVKRECLNSEEDDSYVPGDYDVDESLLEPYYSKYVRSKWRHNA